MRALADCKGLGREELLKEIEDRRWMQSRMVGQLYPSILEDEIDKLHNILLAPLRAIGEELRAFDPRRSAMSNLTEDGLPLVLEVERQRWEAEKKKLIAERDILQSFIEGIAHVEWIKADKNGEKCGYCGCDATESNGPIVCHVEPCLQIKARQALIKAKKAAGV